MDQEHDSFIKMGRDLLLHYPFSPVTPGTIFSHARRLDTRKKLCSILEKLNCDLVDSWRLEMFRYGMNICGEDWDFVDNTSVAHAFAEIAQPVRAMEIGVRRGLTVAALAGAAPNVELHLVDMWEGSYANQSNPGKILVASQLQTVGHKGKVLYHQGDSHQILPRFFKENPKILFDLICVDGDHSLKGAEQDLRDVFPYIAPGGILIFDDISHPAFSDLLMLWKYYKEKLKTHFHFLEYCEHGHGVGIAVRAYEANFDIKFPCYSKPSGFLNKSARCALRYMRSIVKH